MIVGLSTSEPGAPGDLSATALSNAEVAVVTLGWSEPEKIGGSAITGYEYRRSNDGGANWGAWTAIANSGSLTSYLVTGLSADTTYTFQMRAANDSGSGLHSPAAEQQAGTGTLRPPGPPGNFAAGGGDGSADLSWADPVVVGSLPVTKYQYRYATGGRPPDSEWLDVPDSNIGEANRNSYTIGGLTNDVPHTFELRAVSAAGAGEAVRARVTPRGSSVQHGGTTTVLSNLGQTTEADSLVMDADITYTRDPTTAKKSPPSTSPRWATATRKRFRPAATGICSNPTTSTSNSRPPAAATATT